MTTIRPVDLTEAARYWVILGASSAIAREFAREVAIRGAAVVLAGRDLADLGDLAADLKIRGAPSVDILHFDATKSRDRAALLAKLHTLPKGSIDLLLAFAQMPNQQAMEGDTALALQTIDATYTAAAAVLLDIAPLFEAAKEGRIIVIGSVAGDRGRRKNYIYGSAKAGLAILTAGLRARLYPAGVSVTLIKPGFVDTAMSWGMEGQFLVAAPNSVAQAMLTAATRHRDVVYLPFFWAFILFIIVHIPERFFKRLSI